MYKEKILGLLRSTGGGFRSGEDLARKCGISRTMVWKHIKSLEREGFTIEAVPSLGYRITAEPDVLRLDDIRQGLRTRIVGRDILILARVDSTNTRAMEMAAGGAPEGTVVIAETQTGGRGRLGRKWLSPEGNLYLSVVLRPDIALSRAPLLTLMGAVAAATAIRTACGLEAGIKWPNDILLRGKKAAGLLTEMSAEQDRVRHVVLGIGMDVNMDVNALPPEVRELTTTVARESGTAVDRTALLRQVLRKLDEWYRLFLDREDEVLGAWRALNVTTGNRVAVTGAREMIEGLARDIDNEGRLVIEQDDGTVRSVSAGDVSIRKKT